MMRLLIVIASLAGYLSAQAFPFQHGEILTYDAGFRLFSAGRTLMQVSEDTTARMEGSLRIVSRTETYPFFDRVYRIRDQVTVWLDPHTMELRYMVRDIHEGRYERQDTSRVEGGRIYTRRDTLTVEAPIYDPVGVVYYLRNLPLELGSQIELNIFDGRHVRKIAISVRGLETVTVPAGEFECLVLKPASLDQRRLTKVDGLLHLWLSNDSARIPVRLEQKTGFGTMILRLERVE
jgi:hypothetical protein